MIPCPSGSGLGLWWQCQTLPLVFSHVLPNEPFLLEMSGGLRDAIHDEVLRKDLASIGANPWVSDVAKQTLWAAGTGTGPQVIRYRAT